MRNSLQSWAASVLLWAITSAGRWSSWIAPAIVIVLPVPVAPSSVVKRSPASTASAISAIAWGWSAAGVKTGSRRNSGTRPVSRIGSTWSPGARLRGGAAGGGQAGCGVGDARVRAACERRGIAAGAGHANPPDARVLEPAERLRADRGRRREELRRPRRGDAATVVRASRWWGRWRRGRARAMRRSRGSPPTGRRPVRLRPGALRQPRRRAELGAERRRGNGARACPRLGSRCGWSRRTALARAR